MKKTRMRIKHSLSLLAAMLVLLGAGVHVQAVTYTAIIETRIIG
jgi:hypothetical protein